MSRYSGAWALAAPGAGSLDQFLAAGSPRVWDGGGTPAAPWQGPCRGSCVEPGAQKTPSTHEWLRGFWKVAGAGFEPTTSRL